MIGDGSDAGREFEFEPHPRRRSLDPPATGLGVDDNQPESGWITGAAARDRLSKSVALVEHFQKRSVIIEVRF